MPHLSLRMRPAYRGCLRSGAAESNRGRLDHDLRQLVHLPPKRLELRLAQTAVGPEDLPESRHRQHVSHSCNTPTHIGGKSSDLMLLASTWAKSYNRPTGQSMAKRLRKTLPKERLSPSEWEIMRICWRLGRCTVREVLAEDLQTHKRDYRTILTFMGRMSNKGWLAKTKRGNRNLYEPAVVETRAVEHEIDRFLAEVVGEKPESLDLVDRALSRRRARSRR